ncbi:hypothetical protein THRCLA_07389 [Thraustotheca clavata]|uniref:Transmembrane protein n=1 Tax=Thraustotheca clavata TaxID=74557 RepID=A0A1V9ZDH9_9STRA|nr:hypothetical protein THRCLA_07389 [Thraustotheca clavata]
MSSEAEAPQDREWDGMLLSKVKAAQDVNPLTPYLLTPFNTPYSDPSLLVQRLTLSQAEVIAPPPAHYVSNTTCPYIPSERPNTPRTMISSCLDKCLPERWHSYKEWQVWIIQMILLVCGCCMGIPIACFLVLCSPFLLFGAVCTSPCWVCIGIWYYHGPAKHHHPIAA